MDTVTQISQIREMISQIRTVLTGIVSLPALLVSFNPFCVKRNHPLQRILFLTSNF